jgi:hypothetical protein
MQNEVNEGALLATLMKVGDRPDAAIRDVVRMEVETYVDAKRAMGWPCERVVISVKQLAHDAGLGASGFVLAQKSGDTTGRLCEDLVTWSIERYYAS